MPANPYRPPPGHPRAYRFPDFIRQRLAGGLTVWALPQPGSTILNAFLVLDAGAAAEDEAHGGLATLTADLLTNGTRRLDSDAFADQVEQLGISLGSGAGWDTGRVSLQALPEQLEPGLALLSEVARTPRFEPVEFERLRTGRLTSLSQGRADPEWLAEEMFHRYLFDQASPYRRLSGGDASTLPGLTPDDVRAFHAQHWGGGQAHLVMAGPLDADDMIEAASRHLGDWAGSGPGHRDLHVGLATGGRRVILVDRPGSVQSELRIGHLGVDWRWAQDYAGRLMNAMLGGAFSSRLNRRLREELGYTYGAGSNFSAGYAAGPFSAACAVETEVTADAVAEMLGQLVLIREVPPSAAELGEVRDYMVGTFPARFETPGGLVGGLEPLAIYGLPDDHWQTYRANLEAVTASELQAAARRLIRPDELLILVVGDASLVRGPLEALGLGPLEVVQPPV